MVVILGDSWVPGLSRDPSDQRLITESISLSSFLASVMRSPKITWACWKAVSASSMRPLIAINDMNCSLNSTRSAVAETVVGVSECVMSQSPRLSVPVGSDD